MSRYPYTEACDFIRSQVTDYSEELGMRLPTISRSQASQVRQAIALALGMPDEELAKKIADYARATEGDQQ
ncbi:hypothetical protein [Paraburkholderia caballeronis]|uniref:hypothetical protein n=1 Tax=Paraburkholderia caballeronis TaxID=416943 RepID=UPI001065F321|nr:hypothetical protein [Paraburkholderia caballeronis]TDV06021.1 hypothetical protein C7408_1242 [Paraburkholderia caballeronis]TDV09561.1 hypothetical protein C7406_1262 [Paraburkholderia caballeronis]TDV21626.1 hypothetical protein C7404_1212 [Paraburkholderia caballeronis]